MFDWLVKILPASYKWEVAAKKVAYLVGKFAMAGLLYGKVGVYVGAHTSPDQQLALQAGIVTLAAAAIESLHDWAKLRYPQSKWL